MRKHKMNKTSGITLIALVVTIIVLLLLAGISIQMLTGDNGILQRAGQAKEGTERSQEKEAVDLIFTTTQMELVQGKTVDYDSFQAIIDSVFGKENAKGNVGDNSYIITVTKSGKNYKMDSNGNISQLDELPLDINPGVLEGKGTQDEPYVINSIEDLVAVSYNVNTGIDLYEGKILTLGRDLDFEDNNSYANADAKYKYIYGPGCTPDNSSEKTIKELMINTSGNGFTPIGFSDSENVFKGSFNGKGKSLSNIYIDGVAYGGVFGVIASNVSISNLKLINSNVKSNASIGGVLGLNKGNLTIESCTLISCNLYSRSQEGGIVGNNSGTLSIEKCSIKSGNINGSNIIGGIIGQNSGTLDVYRCSNNATISSSFAPAGGIVGGGSGNIDMCYNTGRITSLSTGGPGGVGGIIGDAGANTNIYNCYNIGDIGTETSDFLSGGIIGYSRSEGEIINCHNNGIITSKNPAGGIIGSINTGSIINCYNFNNVTSKNSLAGGIIGGGNRIIIDNCYNKGTIVSNSTSCVGGIAAVSATITNSYNTGSVLGNSEYTTGYIIGSGSVSNTNKYMKQNPEIQSNGAIEFESEAERNTIMDVQRFVDIMNHYKWNQENEYDSWINIWKVENEIPILVY